MAPRRCLKGVAKAQDIFPGRAFVHSYGVTDLVDPDHTAAALHDSVGPRRRAHRLLRARGPRRRGEIVARTDGKCGGRGRRGPGSGPMSCSVTGTSRETAAVLVDGWYPAASRLHGRRRLSVLVDRLKDMICAVARTCIRPRSSAVSLLPGWPRSPCSAFRTRLGRSGARGGGAAGRRQSAAERSSPIAARRSRATSAHAVEFRWPRCRSRGPARSSSASCASRSGGATRNR